MNAKLAITVIWCLASAPLMKLMNEWDSLPDRVAVHFGMALQPNGWSSKRTMAWMVFLTTMGQATLATVLILRTGGLGAMIAPIELAVSVVLVCSFWQLIDYNAKALPAFQLAWIVVPMVLLFATIIWFLLAPVARQLRH